MAARPNRRVAVCYHRVRKTEGGQQVPGTLVSTDQGVEYAPRAYMIYLFAGTVLEGSLVIMMSKRLQSSSAYFTKLYLDSFATGVLRSDPGGAREGKVTRQSQWTSRTCRDMI